jgi:hypothetical protein
MMVSMKLNQAGLVMMVDGIIMYKFRWAVSANFVG